MCTCTATSSRTSISAPEGSNPRATMTSPSPSSTPRPFVNREGALGGNLEVEVDKFSTAAFFHRQRCILEVRRSVAYAQESSPLGDHGAFGRAGRRCFLRRLRAHLQFRLHPGEREFGG